MVRLRYRGRAELKPTGKCNMTCATVIDGAGSESVLAVKRDTFKVTHGEYDDHQQRYDLASG
jgi:hypothetical protein